MSKPHEVRVINKALLEEVASLKAQLKDTHDHLEERLTESKLRGVWLFISHLSAVMGQPAEDGAGNHPELSDLTHPSELRQFVDEFRERLGIKSENENAVIYELVGAVFADQELGAQIIHGECIRLFKESGAKNFLINSYSCDDGEDYEVTVRRMRGESVAEQVTRLQNRVVELEGAKP